MIRSLVTILLVCSLGALGGCREDAAGPDPAAMSSLAAAKPIKGLKPSKGQPSRILDRPTP